jgi:hypothetical protein
LKRLKKHFEHPGAGAGVADTRNSAMDKFCKKNIVSAVSRKINRLQDKSARLLWSKGDR